MRSPWKWGMPAVAVGGVGVKEARRISSLLDFLTVDREHRQWFELKGPVSKFAMSDLASKRDYAEYDVSLGENGLYVSLLLSERRWFGSSEHYGLPDDDSFYRKYGLPAAKAELNLIK